MGRLVRARGRARYGTLDRPYKRRERGRAKRPHVGRRVSRPDELPLVVEVVNKQNAIVRVADERVDPASTETEPLLGEHAPDERQAEPQPGPAEL